MSEKIMKTKKPSEQLVVLAVCKGKDIYGYVFTI